MNSGQIMTSLGLSDLQFALAVIGLLVLILVAIFNFKNARARRQIKLDSEFSSEDRSNREPSFPSGFADAKPEVRAEPTFDQSRLDTPEAKNFTIEPRIDCVITLRFDQVIGGAEILAELHSWHDSQSIPAVKWMCEGLNADVDAAEDWGPLRAEATYAELQLAIQLASRRGPISILELSDFCSRAQALAEVLGAQIDMPSVNTMLESAKELDAMAAESDIQLSINILFDDAYSWANIETLMYQRGFKLSRNGLSFEFFSSQKQIFNTADLDPNKPIKQLTLLLEVPLVEQDEQAFEQMLSEGVEIGQLAHGRLVDDNGINLTEPAIVSIRQHLDGLYANLEKNSIAAGSSVASRLFS